MINIDIDMRQFDDHDFRPVRSRPIPPSSKPTPNPGEAQPVRLVGFTCDVLIPGKVVQLRAHYRLGNAIMQYGYCLN